MAGIYRLGMNKKKLKSEGGKEVFPHVGLVVAFQRCDFHLVICFSEVTDKFIVSRYLWFLSHLIKTTIISVHPNFLEHIFAFSKGIVLQKVSGNYKCLIILIKMWYI